VKFYSTGPAKITNKSGTDSTEGIIFCLSTAVFLNFVHDLIFQTECDVHKLNMFLLSGEKVGRLLFSWVHYRELRLTDFL
jgi:hypothetical protein